MSVLDVTAAGASPDKSDNTDLIQGVMDKAQAGDVVYVPAVGEFKVNALKGLFPRASTSLKVDGVLRAIPNDQVGSVIVNVVGVSNVGIGGTGVIAGDRYQHLGTGPGRHGFCLQILNSTNVTVGGGLTLKEAQADGLYVEDSKAITIENVFCTDNARNGMSLISGESITVKGNIFQLTHSEDPMPQAGIDIEPDLPTQPLLDIEISGNQFVKNKGPGFFIAFAAGDNRHRIYVRGNTFDQHYHDGSGPPSSGQNTWMCNVLYATCRWLPWYDYWLWPREFSVD